MSLRLSISYAVTENVTSSLRGRLVGNDQFECSWLTQVLHDTPGRTAHKLSQSAILPSTLYTMYSWPIRQTSCMFRHFTPRRLVNKWVVEPMRAKRTCILTTFLRMNWHYARNVRN